VSKRGRLCVFWLSLLVLIPFVLRGLLGLAWFGHYPGPYGDVLLAVAPTQRHILNIVTAVNFDYRALDTLGEEFILFAAVAGVGLLLRQERESEAKPGKDAEGEDEADEAASKGVTALKATEAVRVFGLGLIGIILLFGLYIVLMAHLSVGGGFQGGVILATVWLLVYLTGGGDLFERVSPKKGVAAIDAVGAGGYVVVGLAALFSGAAFLENVLPLGKTGSLLSAGAIPIINFAVGIEVAAGFVMLLGDFIKGNAPHSGDVEKTQATGQ
jgi:multicomponent Na+:H+ antiporter subunit B